MEIKFERLDALMKIYEEIYIEYIQVRHNPNLPLVALETDCSEYFHFFEEEVRQNLFINGINKKLYFDLIKKRLNTKFKNFENFLKEDNDLAIDLNSHGGLRSKKEIDPRQQRLFSKLCEQCYFLGLFELMYSTNHADIEIRVLCGRRWFMQKHTYFAETQTILKDINDIYQWIEDENCTEKPNQLPGSGEVDEEEKEKQSHLGLMFVYTNKSGEKLFNKINKEEVAAYYNHKSKTSGLKIWRDHFNPYLEIGCRTELGQGDPDNSTKKRDDEFLIKLNGAIELLRAEKFPIALASALKEKELFLLKYNKKYK